jgi:predicted transcriptional regulator YdeE
MKIVEAGGFAVVGRAARTTNAQEMTGNGVIPKMWMSMPPASARIALYTEYESDEQGAYTFVLGSKAGQGGSSGAGMFLKKVPRGKYVVFTSEKGPVQKVVVETWMKIWAMKDHERSFVADYEVYDERAADPENTVVDIYVGVRPVVEGK